VVLAARRFRDNQTISTIVMIPSEGQAKTQRLLNAQMKLRKVLYAMFGIMKDPTVPPTPPATIRAMMAKPPQKCTGHHVMPPTSQLKKTLVCFHCGNKGHYA
jgi:hypothetical protein